MSNAYEVITWRGHQFDRLTIAAIEAAEKLLGFELHVEQGSYNKGGVALSAGTHDGGGAVDVSVTANPNRVVRCLRAVGFAAWHRLPSEGDWGEHIHAVLIGNEALAPSAQRQTIAYGQGRNGLKSNRPDTTWRPDPIPRFTYPEEWSDMATKEEIKDAFREVLNEKSVRVPANDTGAFTGDPEKVSILNAITRVWNRSAKV